MKRPTPEVIRGLRLIVQLVRLPTVHEPSADVKAALSWIEEIDPKPRLRLAPADERANG